MTNTAMNFCSWMEHPFRARLGPVSSSSSSSSSSTSSSTSAPSSPASARGIPSSRGIWNGDAPGRASWWWWWWWWWFAAWWERGGSRMVSMTSAMTRTEGRAMMTKGSRQP